MPEARRHRPVRLLRRLEDELLNVAACSFCTSQAMSEGLAEAYGCRQPTPIYNAFPWSDRQSLQGSVADRRNPAIPSVYWFSTTLGPGRGVEDLVAALPFVTAEFEIHLRSANASPGFVQALRQQLPERWRDRLFLHGPLDNAELLGRIAEHDIGFAGEMTYCRSRDLTVTNKILHYLLGGLAVVASDTAGQREIAGRATGAILLYGAGDAAVLARRLDELVASPARREAAKRAALAAAKAEFCWERQEQTLIETVQCALSGTLSPDGSAASCRSALRYRA